MIKLNKIELARKIKKFMYDFSLTDKEEGLYIISPSYLKSVLYSAYSENSSENPYSIIVGDFNKLNKINKELGMENADKCMKGVLKIIQDHLPSDAIICRNGGDEFLIILPGNAPIQQIEQYINNIHKQIDERKEELHGLTITLDCGNWSQARNIRKLHEKVDNKVNNIKLHSSSLKDGQYNAYSTLHNSLRLGESFRFSVEEVQRIIQITFDVVSEMLSKYNKNKRFDIPRNSINEYKLVKLDDVRPLDRKTAIRFNSIFLQDSSISEEQLQDIRIESLETIARDLVFCFEPTAFSKDYFNEYLQSALQYDEYKLHFFNLSGLKLVNLIYGHSSVDAFLHKNVYDNVRKTIDKTVCPETTLFSGDGDFYKIYLGGGDILVLEKPDSNYEFSENFERELNSRDDTSLMSEFLKYVVTHSEGPVQKEKINDFVSTTKQNNSSVKDKLKKKILSNDKNSICTDIAYICILPDLKNYCRDNPNDYMDSNKLRAFLEAQLMAMLSYDTSTIAASKNVEKKVVSEAR